MTPAARVSAAIEILDRINQGLAAERALTGWARQSRFAGAKDRAAVRDHVFDALRRRRCFAALGGAGDGRGLMLGALRHAGIEPDTIFTGEGHAPVPLLPQEHAVPACDDLPEAQRLDIPDWLYPRFCESLGAQAGPVLAALQERAGVHLRVNQRAGDGTEAISRLAADGIAAMRHPQVKTALQVTENARKIHQCKAFLEGLVELQDAASQAAILRLPLASGQRVLDYCAGGGGKALAMAANADVEVIAHDIDPARMTDLPARAARAGVHIRTVATRDLPACGVFDIVLCDAPCSGSGTWRRAPDAKWRLTPDMLDRLRATQDEVLAAAAPFVAPGGTLAYATCSVLDEENRRRVDEFLAGPGRAGWQIVDEMRLQPGPLWDGFYLACMTRPG